MLKELHGAMSEGVTINMTIVKKGEELVIMVLPKTKADDAYENLPPFTASGIPEEAEKMLIEGIMNPIKDFSTTVSGIEEFNEGKKEADKETAPAKEAKKKEDKAAKKDDKKAADKSKGKSKTEASAKTAEEKPAAEPVIEKNPAIVKIEEMLAEGKTAVAMKRGITAKSVRAKILNLVAETPDVIGTPLEEQVKEFVASVGVLTGEVDMFATAAPKAEEKPVVAEPAPADTETPKTEE
jgi:PRTRC genetic system protein E